jgi:2',3'-cyclic-nucleotide 2'-phosphodiesterase/3'-nucleotidase
MARRLIVIVAMFMVAVHALAADFESGSYAPAQSIADAIKEEANADMAFLAAGLLRAEYAEGEDTLVKLLQFPTDEVAVVSLTGSQIVDALERAVALYPEPNPRFLQVSGLTVTFNPDAPEEGRIRAVAVDGAELAPEGVYEVAMPVSLAIGGLGYFRIWDRSNVVRTLTGVTLEDLTRSLNTNASEIRWVEVEG